MKRLRTCLAFAIFSVFVVTISLINVKSLEYDATVSKDGFSYYYSIGVDAPFLVGAVIGLTAGMVGGEWIGPTKDYSYRGWPSGFSHILARHTLPLLKRGYWTGVLILLMAIFTTGYLWERKQRLE